MWCCVPPCKSGCQVYPRESDGTLVPVTWMFDVVLYIYIHIHVKVDVKFVQGEKQEQLCLCDKFVQGGL